MGVFERNQRSRDAVVPVCRTIRRGECRGMTKPKIAFIGTGGTIASVGRGPLDIQDYGATGSVMHADEILARWPEASLVADVIPVRFRNIVSPSIGFAEWKALVALCAQLVADHPDLAGIVIGHGTATLEETAYFLNLTVKVSVPVVHSRRAAAVQRLVERRRHEPGQRDPRRRQSRGPRHGRPGRAERRNPCGARGDKDIHHAAADVPNPGLRRAGPCRWRCRRILPPADTPPCAGHGIRCLRDRCPAARRYFLLLCRRRRRRRASVRGRRGQRESLPPASRPAFVRPGRSRRWPMPRREVSSWCNPRAPAPGALFSAPNCGNWVF